LRRQLKGNIEIRGKKNYHEKTSKRNPTETQEFRGLLKSARDDSYPHTKTLEGKKRPLTVGGVGLHPLLDIDGLRAAKRVV